MAAGNGGTNDDGDGSAQGKRAGTAAVIDKRTLLARVVASSGLPAQQAKKLLEAVLTEIGAGLDAGATMSLAPLGKLRPVRTAGSGDGTVHTLRLRRTPARPAASDSGDEAALPGAKARARLKAGTAARRASAGPDDEAGRPAGDRKATRPAAAAGRRNGRGDEDDAGED